MTTKATPPTLTLNNGVAMPVIGLGVFQSPPEETAAAVGAAIADGYRLIDTAASYDNEREVGAAIRASGIDRAEIFVTTKLWIADTGDERTKAAFDRSRKRLQLDSIDLYLIHQPYGDVYGAWRAMEALYRDEKVRAIGVSNFAPDRVMDFLVHHEIAPAIDQVETHPFHQQSETQRFLQENNVQMESWGPFAEGRNGIFENPVLVAIANAHERSVAQVIVRWLIQRGVVAIPKSVRKERMTENFSVFDFELDDHDMDAIKTLDTATSSFFDHRDPNMVKILSEAQRPS